MGWQVTCPEVWLVFEVADTVDWSSSEALLHNVKQHSPVEHVPSNTH